LWIQNYDFDGEFYGINVDLENPVTRARLYPGLGGALVPDNRAAALPSWTTTE